MASILTRDEFITKVLDSTGRPATGQTLSGVSYSTLLQTSWEWVQLRIARAYAFPEMDVATNGIAATVVDTKAYTFTTLFGSGVKVRDIMVLVIKDGLDSRRLKRITERDLYKYAPYPEAESTGKPTYYARVGNAIHLFPLPDAAYSINAVYSKFPSVTIFGTAQSEFDFKDDVLFAGMMVEFLRHLQEYDESTVWEKIFLTKLKESIRPISHPTDWEPEGRAYGSSDILPGEYWNNPFVS